MEKINNQTEKERKEHLRAIKEYISSLLKKRRTEKVQEDIKETITNQNKEQKNKSLRDKLKWKISWETEEARWQTPSKGWFELHQEDNDEYIPRDSEFGEAIGESPRFAEVFPAYTWYYTQGKKSYFDPQTNLRSKKKKLSILEHSITKSSQKYNYAWYLQAGITAIPLPDWALPDTTTLRYHGSQAPIFHIDQNNCVYLVSKKKQAVSFHFTLGETKNNNPPIHEDKQSIIYTPLSQKTEQLLTWLKGKTPTEQARALSYYIKTSKKYNTNKQGTLRNTANSKNYVNKLDQSPILECYSANTLLVALCRQLWIPARLIVWHMVQSVSGDGKAHLSSNNGHAWTEIRDGTQRQRLDATPTTKENNEPSNQNMEENEESWQPSGSNMNDWADSQDGWENQQNKQKWKDQQDGQNWSDKEEAGEGKEGGESEKSKKSWEGKENWESKQDWKNKGDWESGQPKTDNKPEEDKNNEPSNGTNNTQDTQQSSMSWPREQKPTPSKSTEQMLDEFIKKAKEDNLIAQGEQLTKALEKLEKAESKEDIRKILDEAGVTDFAKEEIDKIGNEGILEEEKKELESIEDEKELEEKLQDSLLDSEYKKKLQEYADAIKKKIQEQKDKLRSEMQRFGFNEKELTLYKQYKQLEKEVMPEVKKQIQELQKILPPQYLINKDEENYYQSGARLDRNKLVDRKINNNNKIFQRSQMEQDTQEINMFETIIIDRSWSMGAFNDKQSPFFQSIKAAITRAKVLEHFKVDMSIVIFDDSIDEVMTFGETFSDRRTQIPSKLMRAASTRSWWNSQEPITHVYHSMKDRMKKAGGKAFGNISFIGDGDLYQFNQVPTLKSMIDGLKKQWMGVTAYYINQNQTKMPLIEYYFGKPEDGNAIYAKDSPDLSAKVIGNHKTKLNLLIRKYIKKT
jgi:hypothetical protein